MLMRNLGDNRKYDGKVIWKALNLDKWNYEGQDEKYSGASHFVVYLL
jgi:hypothetical protein